MKRLGILTLVFLPALTVLAVPPKRVLATTTMMADMARHIAGDKLAVECLLPLGGDPHVYEPTPADAQKVANAHLILLNGLTLEGWMKELIDNSGTKATLKTLTDGVVPIQSEVHAGAVDPHAWMSAQNGRIYARNIYDAFVALDPLNQAVYTQNYRAYDSALLALDQFIKDKISQIPEKQRILITSHDAFHYFGLAYGLRLESVMGTSTDADVQTSDIIRLVKIIKTYAVPAIFIESTISPKLLQQLAKDNRTQIGGQLFADSLGDTQSGAAHYIDMLRHDAETIAAALSGNITAPQTATPVQALTLVGGLLVFMAACGLLLFFFTKKGSKQLNY